MKKLHDLELEFNSYVTMNKMGINCKKDIMELLKEVEKTDYKEFYKKIAKYLINHYL